jgi:hypothetical protein
MDNRALATERRIEKEMAALQAMAYSKDPPLLDRYSKSSR